MGDRPNAHLWFGTKPTEEHPWTTRYEEDDDGNETAVEPTEDAYDAGQRIDGADGPTVLVNLSNGYGDGWILALATVYHQTDWDDALDLETLETPGPEAIADLLRVAAEEGWPSISAEDLAWRLGASYG